MSPDEKTHPTVSLIEGDGIGPEIAVATLRAIEAAGGKLEWERVDAGAGAVAKHGGPLPQATIDSIKRTQLCSSHPSRPRRVVAIARST